MEESAAGSTTCATRPLGVEPLAALLVDFDGVEDLLEGVLSLEEEPGGLRSHCSWLPPQ